jgi:uncharacterized protein
MSGRSAQTPLPYAADGRGLRLAVRVTPRAGREAVGGIVRDADGRPALAVRLAAPPVEGAANAALVKVLAGALGLRRAEVTLLSGATGRLKMLHLAGDPAALAARLDALIRDAA